MASDVLMPEPLRPLRRAGTASMAPATTATATMKMLFLSTKNCRRSTEVPELKCGGPATGAQPAWKRPPGLGRQAAPTACRGENQGPNRTEKHIDGQEASSTR